MEKSPKLVAHLWVDSDGRPPANDLAWNTQSAIAPSVNAIRVLIDLAFSNRINFLTPTQNVNRVCNSRRRLLADSEKPKPPASDGWFA